MTTIGFFGDSFCAKIRNEDSVLKGYDTYIQMLSKHYDAKIVNTGHGGSSVWDTLLIQLNPFVENNQVPDICVFVWTIPGRLFNRKIRRLNSSDVETKFFSPFKRNIVNAAKQFYNHLYDHEKEEIEHVALLRYIDQVVLPTLPAQTKIVHLWTAGKTKDWSLDGLKPSNITYPHTWSNGSEIRPGLLSLSLYDSDMSILNTDKRANHLDGNFKNELVFNWIKTAIDNPPTAWDYSNVVSDLQSR